MRVGQWAIAVGRTFEGDRPNMAVGILSALGRIWGKAIQTDAAVSPNNYGGPLVDIRGRVLGVLVPLSPEAADEVAGVEWYDSGIGFAVPLEHILQDPAAAARRARTCTPGVAGISLPAPQPATRASRSSPPAGPTRPPPRPASRPGDRIVEIDGRKIARAAEVKRELSRRYAGDKIRIGRAPRREAHRARRGTGGQARALPAPVPGHPADARRERPKPGVDRPLRLSRRARPPRPRIEPGDVLVSLDGKPIPNRDELVGNASPSSTSARRWRSRCPTRVERRSSPCNWAGCPRDCRPPNFRPRGPRSSRSRSSRARSNRARSTAGRRGAGAGAFGFKIDGVQDEAWAYVPAAYDPAVPHGVVVWLHGSEAFDWDKLLARWKPLCDRRDLILVAPKAADKAGWTPRDGATVERLLDEILTTYTVDPARVVAAGNGRGGALAYLFAEAERETVRAAVVCDGPLAGEPDALDPSDRLAIYLAAAKKSRYAAMVKAAIGKIRDAKIPLTIKDLGENSRELSDDELDELVRWIDMLDRI